MCNNLFGAKAPKSQGSFSIAPALRPGQLRISLLWALAHIISLVAYSQKEVPQQVMQKIYEEVKTPYKY